ncbi:hypothetical protein AB0I99_00735 [Streptomyces spongiicola]|uniref:hypothetical protein n=1 Tax=Streptomyces spongiicola TaxID=1690221 RepID=UPI0033D55443
MEIRDREAVEADVEKASSRILEMLALEGKVTESGAMTARCADYDSGQHVYRARHPWSVHQVPFADMQKAMDRLRSELPKRGWEIRKDGVDGSVGKSPQIIAESEGRTFSLDVRLHKASEAGGAPELLEVTVESACYRTK